MPKVTEAHLEARRQQVLDAAMACFAREGFHRTTMQSICSEAALSPGAVYRYFRGKDDIIEAMSEEGRRRTEQLISAATERGETEQVLNQLADSFFYMLDEPEAEPITRVNIQLWAEALRNERILALLQRRNDGTRTAFAGIIARAQDKGEINPDLDPDSIARIMIALFQGLVLQKGLDPDVDVRRYVEAMKALEWKGA